jgi:hypothetical protein
MDQPSESRKRKVSQTELIMDPPPPKCAQETTLECVADDLDGAAHARMDELVLATIDSNETSSSPLTYLLILIVQNSSI